MTTTIPGICRIALAKGCDLPILAFRQSQLTEPLVNGVNGFWKDMPVLHLSGEWSYTAENDRHGPVYKQFITFKTISNESDNWLSDCLQKNMAAIIYLPGGDTVLVGCKREALRLTFEKSTGQKVGDFPGKIIRLKGTTLVPFAGYDSQQVMGDFDKNDFNENDFR